MKFNLKVISNIIGILLMINGFLMLTAVPFGVYHNEGSWKGILISALINSAVGFFLYYRTKDNENKDLKKRDGYLIVISSWVFLSFFGMLYLAYLQVKDHMHQITVLTCRFRKSAEYNLYPK